MKKLDTNSTTPVSTVNLTTPVSKDLLEKELTKDTLARMWRNLEIHFVKKQTAPNVILEVNRISAVMFNLPQIDGDVFDDTYIYIVVYDRINGEIVSFYRYILCKDAIHGKHDVRLSTATYFNFSDEFVEKILPVTIEFGRSVVNKTAKNQESGLQAVWAGLGILVYEYYQHPRDLKIEYFFGKFSLQWNIYKEDNRNMILYLYQKHFSPVCGKDSEVYMKPRFEFETVLDFSLPGAKMNAETYKVDRQVLVQYLKDLELPMPKLADTYANLGGLVSFGTITNKHLNSWETAILQNIAKINSSYIRRFVDGYKPINKSLFV
jgi:putative hemolysin